MTAAVPVSADRAMAAATSVRPATGWRRPAWDGAGLHPRWLLFSLALHGTALFGLVLAGRTAPPAPVPHFALYQVLGATPPPPPPPPDEVTPPPVDVEEEMTVELRPTPEPEPTPIAPREPVNETPFVVYEPPPRRPDRTVVRRRPPPPPLAVTPPPVPPPAPVPPPPPAVGNASAPVPIAEENAPPIYPRRAIALRQEGTVRLRVEVDAGGLVLACAIARPSGSTLLDEAARCAVERWHFAGGAGSTEILIEFVLIDRRARAGHLQAAVR
jgi:protein TonB